MVRCATNLWELSIIMSRFAGLTPLLAPRSIAVLGASSDAPPTGAPPIPYMQPGGFRGPLNPATPTRAKTMGLKAYPPAAARRKTPAVAIAELPAELAVPAI